MNPRPADSFRQRVTVNDATGCFEWTAAKNRKGYGQVRVAGRLWIAHRLAYEWFVGRIPEGMQLDHHCRNHACVNVMHLEPVTHIENQARGVGRHARALREGVCVNGHQLIGENVILRRGSRECRTCENLLQRKRWQRKRQDPAWLEKERARGRAKYHRLKAAA